MARSHADVIERFAKRVINRRTGTVEWTGTNVFCHDGVLYSYGPHFPLAVDLGGEEPLFLKNGDGYSSATSGHQSQVQSKCPGPTVSRRVLSEALGMHRFHEPFTRLREQHLVHYTEDVRRDVFRDYKDAPWRFEDSGEPVPRNLGAVWSGWSGEGEPDLTGRYHLVGASVWKGEDGRYVLAAMDEGTYFAAILPEPVTSVEKAFHILKPGPVLDAEARGLAVKRQGEWFFIPLDLHGDRAMRDWLEETRTMRDFREEAGGGKHLPRPIENGREQGNRHVCTRLLVREDALFARGTVRHRDDRNQATGEHAPLLLAREWHAVFRNTEKRSWSMGASGLGLD